MSQSCPISLQRIDSHLVRIIALQVITIALLLLWSGSLFFAFILLFDFLVRSLELKHLSPFAKVGKFIIHHLNIKPQLCDEAPKRFALYLGLGIIGFFTLLFVFGFSKIATLLVGILLLCASLEAAFDYCIGCKIYHYIQIIWGRK
ncbi:DUF4395 domain-containing protein [bacterium]|nr:DUF4395 domain-containing protein [bacterium]MBU1958107.1 DUF4395 domain-containing protein [bacterium]